MRVQVRVTSAGIAVRERDREETPGIDLLHAVRAHTRVDRLALEPADDVAHRRVVCFRYLARQLRVGERPQRRHALDRRERQVVAGYRLRAGSRGADDIVSELTRVDRLPAVIAGEPLATQLGP